MASTDQIKKTFTFWFVPCVFSFLCVCQIPRSVRYWLFVFDKGGKKSELYSIYKTFRLIQILKMYITSHIKVDEYKYMVTVLKYMIN